MNSLLTKDTSRLFCRGRSLLLTTPTSQANQASGYEAMVLPRCSLLNAPQTQFSTCSVTWRLPNIASSRDDYDDLRR
jgi:hypothetical protein